MKKLSYVTDEKGHGYFRKNKAVKGLATAIAIGGVLISSSNAKADEVVDVTATGNDVLAEAGDASLAAVVAETTATNYSEPQPEASAEHLQALANEGQVVGEGITSPVESSSLDQAVAEAVAVEVIVTESQTPIVKDNLNEAQAALDNQEKKVDEAKETKVEVDSILAGNTEKAKKADVIETPTKAVTYTDDNKLAKEDAKEQEARVDVAVDTQIKVSNQLPQAVREAIEGGVEVAGVSFDGDKVVFDNTVRYADTVKALDNLAKQVAELKNAGATQKEIDSLISQAVADLRKTGAKVTLSNSANAEDVETALNKAKNYVTKLAEIQEAQGKINATQSSALTSANSNSLKVNTAQTAFETSDIQEGVANAESNAKALTDGVANQTLGNSIISDAVADARSKGTDVEVATTPQIVTSAQAETIAKQQAEAIALVVTENDKKRQAWETAKSEFQKAYAEYQRLLAEYNTAVANAESVKALNAQIEQANAELNTAVQKLNNQIEELVASSTARDKNNTGTIPVSSVEEAKQVADTIFKSIEDVKFGSEGTVTTELRDKIVQVVDEANKAEFEQALANAKSKSDIPADTGAMGEGYSLGSSSTNLNDVVLNGAHIVATGTLSESEITGGGYSIYVNNDNSSIPTNHIITSIKWTDQEVVALDGGRITYNTFEGKRQSAMSVDLVNSAYGVPSSALADFEAKSFAEKLTHSYNYNDNGTTTQVVSVEVGKWYKIPNAVTLADGSTQDLVFKAEVPSTDKLDSLQYGGMIDVWNQDGAINMINGYATIANGGNGIFLTNAQTGAVSESTRGNTNSSRMSYRIGSVENTDSYLWLNVISDLDVGQVILDDGGMTTVSVGGGIARNTLRAASFLTGDVKGISDAPMGTLAVAHYGSEYAYTIQNDVNATNATGVARADFGNGATIKPIYSEKVEQEEVTVGGAVSYSYIDYQFLSADPTPTNPVPPVPDEPKDPGEEPKEPDYAPAKATPLQVEVDYQETILTTSVVTPLVGIEATGIQVTVPTHPIEIKTTVNPVEIVQKPTNIKVVKNADGVDINGQSVVKGDLVSWDTGGETLKAGRPQFSSITRIDYLRAGQTVDMDLTRASSADIEFTYDSAKHAVIQTVSSRVLAEANLDQTKAFILPEGKIYATPVHDGGKWENTFETVFEYADSVIIDKDGKVKTEGTVNTYKVTSNKVGITTPEKAEPEKHIYTADGERVDGKSLLPNTTYYYTAAWDLSKYKGVVSTAKQILDGFAYIGDPQDNTVRFDKLNYVWETSSGEVISNDFIKAYEFNSIDEVPEEYKDLIIGSGVTPEGYFVAYIPTDYNKFYNDYVVKGEKLYLTFAVHTDRYVGDFENKVYQIDFGNGYEGNIVQNHVPKLEAIKDVIDHIGSNKSLNNATIELGQTFPYVLNSPAIPMNLAGGVHEVMLYDDFDENYDRYDGEYYAFLKRPLELKNGKGLVTDEEFTKYVRQVVERNDAGEIVAVKFYVEEDFLAQIKEDQILEFVIYPMMTRIAYGENIENTLVAYINGVEVSRTKVVTHTPKPVPPVEQGQPGTPVEAPVTPVEQAPIGQPATPTLPKTGETTQASALFAGLGLMTLAGLGFAKRKEDY